jgi:hypothetical protein
MVLKDILAISGEPGLFKFIAQGKNAIIVEHLETKKRGSAYGSAKVSSLEDIAIFTETEDMPLGKVFDLIYEKAGVERLLTQKLMQTSSRHGLKRFCLIIQKIRFMSAI